MQIFSSCIFTCHRNLRSTRVTQRGLRFIFRTAQVAQDRARPFASDSPPALQGSLIYAGLRLELDLFEGGKQTTPTGLFYWQFCLLRQNDPGPFLERPQSVSQSCGVVGFAIQPGRILHLDSGLAMPERWAVSSPGSRHAPDVRTSASLCRRMQLAINPIEQSCKIKRACGSD
jgi:hypothetical protein